MKIRSSKTKNKNRNKFLNNKNKIKNKICRNRKPKQKSQNGKFKIGELAKSKFVFLGNQNRKVKMGNIKSWVPRSEKKS